MLRFKRFVEQTELFESHFEVGDKVKCVHSGKEGVVTKVDPSEKGKYYTVKRDDGEVMQYAPDDLEALKEEVELDEEDDSFAPSEEDLKRNTYLRYNVKQLEPMMKDALKAHDENEHMKRASDQNYRQTGRYLPNHSPDDYQKRKKKLENKLRLLQRAYAAAKVRRQRLLRNKQQANESLEEGRNEALKALEGLAKRGGMDKADFQKAHDLYKANKFNDLRKLIYGLDTDPSEAIADVINRHDSKAFNSMYPKAKAGDYLRSIILNHGGK